MLGRLSPATTPAQEPDAAPRALRAWLVPTAAVVAGVVAWRMLPLWAGVAVAATAALAWAVERLRPEGQSLLGRVLDLLAEAIVDAARRVLGGVALGLGMILVVVALGGWALSRVEGELGHLEHSVVSSVPHPSLPSFHWPWSNR